MKKMDKTKVISYLLMFLILFTTGCKSNNTKVLPKEQGSAVTKECKNEDKKQLKELFLSYLNEENKNSIDKTTEMMKKCSEQEKEEILLDTQVRDKLNEVISNSNKDKLEKVLIFVKDTGILNDYRFFIVYDMLSQLREQEGDMEYYISKNKTEEVEKIKKDICKHKENIMSVFTSKYKYTPFKDENPVYQNIMWDKITASSQLKSAEGAYKPELVQDFKNETAWVEGSEGDGIGEWIKLESNYLNFVSRIKILNGYRKSEYLYNVNNVPTKVKIEFSDGTTLYRELEDYFEAQNIINLDKEILTSYIKITILKVSKGSKYSDTCISEIKVGELSYRNDVNNSKKEEVSFKSYREHFRGDDVTGITYHLCALNNKGKIIWEKVWDNLALGQFGPASACAVSEGTAYIEVYGDLYAFDLHTGEKKWGGIDVGCCNVPVIDSDGTIYCTAFDGPASITAVNPDGTIKWQEGPGSTYAIKIKDDLLYVFYEYGRAGEKNYSIYDKKGNLIEE